MSVLAAFGIGEVCGTCGERKPAAQFIVGETSCVACCKADGDIAPSLFFQINLNRQWKPTQQQQGVV